MSLSIKSSGNLLFKSGKNYTWRLARRRYQFNANQFPQGSVMYGRPQICKCFDGMRRWSGYRTEICRL